MGKFFILVAVLALSSAARAQPQSINFRNHVIPVLTKAACNSGACHGALAGKGGLKLSLRGYDPQSDYDALTRQTAGRRVVKGSPERSLALLKPTMAIGHGGGERIKKHSLDYRILAAWIRAGARGPSEKDPAVRKLEVSPVQVTLKPGDSKQITVRAVYSDGRTEDVTRWVKFSSNETAVAAVDDFGKVKVNGNGETAITAWFSSKVAFATVTAPYQTTDPRPATAAVRPGSGYVDELIYRKLDGLGIPASAQAGDSEFIRRAFLDSCGILPSAVEVKAFLADQRADKRPRLIDALLSRTEFVDYWSYKWSDLFLVSSKKLNGRALTSFYNWIRDSVATNKPWDRMVREIITAEGSTLENGAANFYVLHKDPIDQTETTTQAFLGMSVQCARCHNHPLEKWTQDQYYQMANLFARVRLKNGDQAGDVLVLTTRDGNVNHPRLGRPMAPAPLDGREMSPEDPRDRRKALADWLVAPNNPYFAKALVNRVWRNFMGRALVEAEDDLRLTNPPSNQELFDALAADFARDYDVKRLIRTIMTSAGYQRSAAPVGINARDDRYYSRYIVRRLPAEVLLDAVSQVTGAPTVFPGYPSGTRSLQLRDSQVNTYFLASFGRPERVQTCSCERQDDPTIAQALHLANGETINQKLREKTSVVESLFESEASDEEVIEELYLSALSRYPTESERKRLLAILAESPDDPFAPDADRKATRRAALEDLYWAVLTDKEFLFNH